MHPWKEKGRGWEQAAMLGIRLLSSLQNMAKCYSCWAGRIALVFYIGHLKVSRDNCSGKDQFFPFKILL